MGDVVSPDFAFREEGGRAVLAASGDWVLETLPGIEARLGAAAAPAGPVTLDLGGAGRLDTAGAFVLLCLSGLTGHPEALEAQVRGATRERLALLAGVARASQPAPLAPVAPQGFVDMLSRLGRGAASVAAETVDTLSFVGEALTRTGRLLLDPGRLRLTSTVAIAEEAGLDAMPIVAFLSFFVGMVVAFIGATTLADLGASIFVVELVGISVLREFGLVITAIILAGRTNSAFTAQIGAMKMRQEIDALAVIGLDPMDVLVVPRLLAMLIMVPILTFVATVSGVLGGMIVAWGTLDISPGFFLNRMLEGVPIQNLWVGLSKSPAVALIVALIGCRKGLSVGSSVTSLGQSTTASVVHAIFAIIVMDAIFALFYMELDI